MTRPGGAPGGIGTVWNLVHLGVGQVMTTVMTLFLSATMARKLGASDFGLLYLVTTIATFVYVVVDWGHAPFIIRETARCPDRTGELLGSSLVLRSGSAVVIGSLAVATTWLMGYDLRTRLLTGLLILSLLPQYLGLSFGWVFRGRERMDRDAFLNVLLKLATVALSIPWLLMGGGPFGLVVAWCVAGCIALMSGIAMYRRLALPRISPNMPTVRLLLRDGASFLAMSLASSVEPYINANILYKMASPEVVGWYGVAANIGGTLIAPATLIGATMYPRWSKVAGDDAEFKRAFNGAFRPLFLAAVLGAVGTYLFADVAVRLIYSTRKFGPAADTLRAFAPVLLLMSVDMFAGMAILASGKGSRIAVAKVAAVLVTTALLFYLVPLCQMRFANGGMGVMYAMVVTESLLVVVSGFLIRRAVDGGTCLHIGKTLAAGIGTALLFRALPSFTPFLAIPMCVLVFLGLARLLGAVSQADINMLLGSLRKPGLVAR